MEKNMCARFLLSVIEKKFKCVDEDECTKKYAEHMKTRYMNVKTCKVNNWIAEEDEGVLSAIFDYLQNILEEEKYDIQKCESLFQCMIETQGITVEKFAERLGFTKETVDAWINKVFEGISNAIYNHLKEISQEKESSSEADARGTFLESRIFKQGMTKETFANRIGCCKSTVYAWTKGSTDVLCTSPNTLPDILKCLNITYEELEAGEILLDTGKSDENWYMTLCEYVKENPSEVAVPEIEKMCQKYEWRAKKMWEYLKQSDGQQTSYRIEKIGNGIEQLANTIENLLITNEKDVLFLVEIIIDTLNWQGDGNILNKIDELIDSDYLSPEMKNVHNNIGNLLRSFNINGVAPISAEQVIKSLELYLSLNYILEQLPEVRKQFMGKQRLTKNFEKPSEVAKELKESKVYSIDSRTIVNTEENGNHETRYAKTIAELLKFYNGTFDEYIHGKPLLNSPKKNENWEQTLVLFNDDEMFQLIICYVFRIQIMKKYLALLKKTPN